MTCKGVSRALCGVAYNQTDDRNRIRPENVFNAVQELNEKRQKNICHIKGGTSPLSGTIKCNIGKLQKELNMLTKSNDEDETLEQINMLVEYFESRKQLMIEFEEETFEFLVDKIIVDQNELEFHLLDGLKFTEKHIDILS